MDRISFEQRKLVLEIFRSARRGHIGSTFSILEITRVLYESILKYNPQNPQWEDRDRFILSKGHGCIALYIQLAEHGFFSKDLLYTFCSENSILGGHPEYKKVPGVEASTGSLGHGLAIGVGIALSAKIDKKNYHTYVLIGDGECNEGSIWESALSAAKHQLDNLTVLVDYNKMQSYSYVSEVQNLEPLLDKWKAFGFEVKEIDGHNLIQLKETLSSVPFSSQKPSLVICHTVKGKGIPETENNAGWHHKTKAPDDEIDEILNSLERQQQKVTLS